MGFRNRQAKDNRDALMRTTWRTIALRDSLKATRSMLANITGELDTAIQLASEIIELAADIVPMDDDTDD